MPFIQRGRIPLNMTNSIVISIATPRNPSDQIRGGVFVFWVGHNEDGTPFERPSKRGFMLTPEQMRLLAEQLQSTADEIDNIKDIKGFIRENTEGDI